VRDQENNPGYLTGQILHNAFSDWNFDIIVDMEERMLVMNTNQELNSLYYGKAYTKGYVSIYGYDDQLEFDINLKTEAGTKFVMPMTSSEENGIGNFIRFVSSQEPAREELLDLSGIKLKFDLDITPDADFQIIFDSNYAIPRFWLMSFGYLSFANLLVFLIRRSGLTTIAYFGYIFIFEFLVRMLHLYYFKHRSILFYPINSIEDIMPNPLFKLPDFWMEKAWGFKPLLTYGEASISALIYSIVIVYLTWVIFKKRDI
jgi:hypothetical protein